MCLVGSLCYLRLDIAVENACTLSKRWLHTSVLHGAETSPHPTPSTLNLKGHNLNLKPCNDGEASGRGLLGYRGTSIMRNRAPLGLYSKNMPKTLCWSKGGRAVSYERGTPVGYSTLWSLKVSFICIVERYVPKFAQHEVLTLITNCMLTFDERVHRVVRLVSSSGASWLSAVEQIRFRGLKAKARIWLCLYYVFNIRSTAGPPRRSASP